jgi:hypothetical protein
VNITEILVLSIIAAIPITTVIWRLSRWMWTTTTDFYKFCMIYNRLCCYKHIKYQRKLNIINDNSLRINSPELLLVMSYLCRTYKISISKGCSHSSWQPPDYCCYWYCGNDGQDKDFCNITTQSIIDHTQLIEISSCSIQDKITLSQYIHPIWIVLWIINSWTI